MRYVGKLYFTDEQRARTMANSGGAYFEYVKSMPMSSEEAVLSWAKAKERQALDNPFYKGESPYKKGVIIEKTA